MSVIKWLEHLRGDGAYSLREAQNSLLQVLLTEFDLSRNEHGLILNVSFQESHTAIRSREAKRYVKREMPGYTSKVADIQDRIDSVVFRGESRYLHDDPDFAFRYASGGTLPIVELESVYYYCLFYRDVFPVGWNIANGACDSLPELLNPKRTIERELREELIVLALHSVPPTDYAFTWSGKYGVVVPEFEYVRKLAQRFLADELSINRDFKKKPLQIHWDPPGPDTLRVTFNDQEPLVQGGFYLNINAHDFGIELDRIARIRLPRDVVLLDGEINDNRLLNQPVGLFEVSKTQKAVYEGLTEFLPDRLYYGAAPELSSPPSSSGEFREQVIKRKFLEHLERFGVRSQRDVEEWENTSSSNCFDLCPVTRTIIRRHMRAASIRVFISYSHADRSFVERLEEDLDRWSIKVWRDAQKADPAVPISVHIKRAIEDSSHVLLLASKHSVVSKFVLNEVQYASDIRKPGMTVMRERLEHRDIPLPTIQWPQIDFQQRYPEALSELVKALRR